MPPPLSAGVLLYRRTDGDTQVLLVHPGGPYWANKDAGAWMIPKGGVSDGETPADAAIREFEEEVGLRIDAPPFPTVPHQAVGREDRRGFCGRG